MNPIRAVTPPEKRALAAALAEHDPEFLADLKAMAGRFGAFESVEYQSDTHGAAVAAMFAERCDPEREVSALRAAEQAAARAAKNQQHIDALREMLNG